MGLYAASCLLLLHCRRAAAACRRAVAAAAAAICPRQCLPLIQPFQKHCGQHAPCVLPLQPRMVPPAAGMTQGAAATHVGLGGWQGGCSAAPRVHRCALPTVAKALLQRRHQATRIELCTDECRTQAGESCGLVHTQACHTAHAQALPTAPASTCLYLPRTSLNCSTTDCTT